MDEEMPKTGTALDFVDDGDELVEDNLLQLSTNNRILIDATQRVQNRRSHLRLQDFLGKPLPSAEDKGADSSFEYEAAQVTDAVHDLTDDITDQIQASDYSLDDLEATFVGTKNKKQKKVAKKVEHKVEKKDKAKVDENASVEDAEGHYPFLMGKSPN